MTITKLQTLILYNFSFINKLNECDGNNRGTDEAISLTKMFIQLLS